MTISLLDEMLSDIRLDSQVLRVKRCIVKILESLPDDEARSRVLRAAMVLMEKPS